MSSLIIKVTQNGSSKEYIFNKLGPITIGSDEKSDLWIDDPQLDSKLLEVKISGGNIFVKEVGARGEIYLDSAILPFREETRLHEGSCLSIKNLNYHIHISKGQGESAEPPPFFESEYKERLERMNFKIKEREVELKQLDIAQDKKRTQISDLESKYHHHVTEKNKLEVDLTALKTQRDHLSAEIKKKNDKNQDEEEKLIQLREFVKRLENEERQLKDTIVAQNLVLTNLKDEREKKSKEVDRERVLLATLQLDTTKMEAELKDLILECDGQKNEIQSENLKIQQILSSTEAAIKEGNRIQGHMAQLLKEKTLLDHEVNDLQVEVTGLEKTKIEAQERLLEIRTEIDRLESESRKIQDSIKRESEEESNLKIINGELRSELVKAEEKLSLKKNQINQIEYQNQDATRKLATINFEMERATLRLKELNSEERAQELKMLAIRDDIHNLSRKATDEKKAIYKAIEEEKSKLSLELNSIRNEIEESERHKAKVDSDHGLLLIQIQELELKQKATQKEKLNQEAQFNELKSIKTQTENQLQLLKDETTKLEHDKGRIHRELIQLQMKLQDCETIINEKQQEARIEMENFKREERAKLAAEKEVYLAEVETFKQKSLVEVEAEYRRKEDDIHQMKHVAQEQVDEILKDARRVENEITQEASARLKTATIDAQERELASHARIKEAQEYFKQKETEADYLLNKARVDARDLIKKTEQELLEDLSKRKQKIKKFLTIKQENGLLRIRNHTDQHVAKLRRDEEKAHQRLEDIKRKELKKMAKLREEEVTRQAEVKKEAMAELKVERETILRQIHELKKSQEAELADKKKSMLEHINSTKYSQQKNWEDELRKERDGFNRTKKERIANATQAVLNVFIAESGPQGEKELALKEKIKSTLEMAIDGQSASALKEIDQVLDFNPNKRKKIAPVLQKYALRVGVPAAIVITVFADIGNIRTLTVQTVKELLKQQHSASEMYVNQQKTEWKEKHTYTPSTTPDYKATFTENVVYTTDFEKVMENEEFQNDWILKVHDFMVKELELSEDVAISYISSEGTLIKELVTARKDLHPQFLEVGMKKLTDLEEVHLGWLKEKIPEQVKMEKFADFRKDYYNQFYESKFKGQRGIAGE